MCPWKIHSLQSASYKAFHQRYLQCHLLVVSVLLDDIVASQVLLALGKRRNNGFIKIVKYLWNVRGLSDAAFLSAKRLFRIYKQSRWASRPKSRLQIQDVSWAWCSTSLHAYKFWRSLKSLLGETKHRVRLGTNISQVFDNFSIFFKDWVLIKSSSLQATVCLGQQSPINLFQSMDKIDTCMYDFQVKWFETSLICFFHIYYHNP